MVSRAVDVPHAREMFRKRLDRAGFQGAIAVGGSRGWLGSITCSAGSCMPTCSPSASSPQAWGRAGDRLEEGRYVEATQAGPAVRPRRAAVVCASNLCPSHRPGRRRVPLPSGSSRRTCGVVVARIASRTLSFSLTATVVAAVASSSTSSCFVTASRSAGSSCPQA